MDFVSLYKNGFNYADTRLKSGITVDFIPTPITLFHKCDPWRFFVTFGFENTLAFFAITETTHFSEAKYNLLRETIVNYPAIGPSTSRSVVESQVIVNANTKTIVQNSLRERDRSIIVLAPIFWISAHVFSFDIEARSNFITAAMSYDYVPQVVSELFLRTRNCTNGMFRFTNGIVLASFAILVGANPSLKNTFWDPEFLRSPIGCRAFLDFCTFLALKESNYIPMVKPSNVTLPPFESGFTVTFNAFTVSSGHSFLNATVYVVQNALQQPNFVYAADCVIASCQYFTTVGNIFTGHEATSLQLQVDSSTGNCINHIIYRVTGIQPNTNKNKFDDMSDPPKKEDRRPAKKFVAKRTPSPRASEPSFDAPKSPKPNFKSDDKKDYFKNSFVNYTDIKRFFEILIEDIVLDVLNRKIGKMSNSAYAV